jgi:hypothetical protein
MFWEAVAAHAGATPRLVKTPDDWLAVVATVGWRPNSADAALAACVEVVAVAGPRGSRLWTPFLYRDPASLTSADSVTGIEAFFAEELLKTGRLRPPGLRPKGPGAWEASFWMIEARQTTHDRCRIAPSSLELAATDSIMGLGICTPGP